MRVISGIAHGRKLKSPDDNLKIRPTISRIKEAVFNSISDKISGSFFLDLYSGSGAIGIEALSRGAEKCFFVEHNKLCAKIIKENLFLTKLIKNAEIICDDSSCSIKKLFEQKIYFHLIFMDPPYYKNLVAKTLICLEKYNLLAPGAIIICETSSRENIFETYKSDRFDFFKTKKYNNVMINYLREK